MSEISLLRIVLIFWGSDIFKSTSKN